MRTMSTTNCASGYQLINAWLLLGSQIKELQQSAGLDLSLL
jgi:hypothetical protein